MKKIILHILFLFGVVNILFSYEREFSASDKISEIQEAINNSGNGATFYFKSGEYFFSKTDNLKIRKSNIKLIGQSDNSTVFKFNSKDKKFAGFIDIDSSNSVLIEHIVFNGVNKSSFKPILNIGEHTQKVSINKCIFKNLINQDGQIYAIVLSAVNSKDFEISNNRFQNISSIGDGVVGTARGMCGGILIIKNEILPSDKASKGFIKKNIFDSIYLQRVGDEIDYDADGIRFFIPISEIAVNNKIKKNIFIEDNKFLNVEKSAIKIQSFPGVVIRRNIINSKMENQFMLAGIRVYGDFNKTRNVYIYNNEFTGNLQRCAILNGTNIVFSDNIYNSNLKNKYPAIQIGYQQDSKNIKIKNFIFESDEQKYNYVNKATKLKFVNCSIKLKV